MKKNIVLFILLCFSALVNAEVKTHYEGATAIREKGVPTRIILKGNHYEMGKQYGVLLKEDIKLTLKDVDKILGIISKENGVPKFLLKFLFSMKTKKYYEKIEKRFKDEMDGIASGAGIKKEEIILISFFGQLELSENSKCSTIITKNLKNEFIHLYNNDSTLGKFKSQNTVIIKYIPDHYNSYIDIKEMLSMGSYVGRNEKGIIVSENSVVSRKYDNGYPTAFIIRQILEEADTIDKVENILKKVEFETGSSIGVSSVLEKKAALFDIVPQKEQTVFSNNIDVTIWGINNYKNSKLSNTYEKKGVRGGAYNSIRTKTLSQNLNEKLSYSTGDLISIINKNIEDESMPYYKRVMGPSNVSTIKSILFNEANQEVLISNAAYFSGSGKFTSLSYNLNEKSKVYSEEKLNNKFLQEFGEAFSQEGTSNEMIERLKKISSSYPDNSFIRFWISQIYFEKGDYENWKKYIQSAYMLDRKSLENVMGMAVLYYNIGETEKLKETLYSIKYDEIYDENYGYVYIILNYYLKNKEINLDKINILNNVEKEVLKEINKKYLKIKIKGDVLK